MAAESKLVVTIAGSFDSLDKATRGAVEKIKRMGSDLTSLGSTMALSISAPLAAFAGIAVNSAANLEALKNGLTAVTGSSIEAGRQFQQLKEVAKLPGLGFEEAVRGATNLQAIGFQFGQSKNLLLQFGNALASVGRGREDLDEVIRQLGQMASRGKVTADNLKPIIERVPQAAAIIKREFGTIDTEQLQKLGISAQTMIAVLERELGKLPRVTGGLKNDIENFRDAVTFAFADAGNAIAPFAKKFLDDFAVPAVNMIPQLAKAFNDLSPSVQGFSLGIVGVVAAAPLLITAIGTVISNFGVLSSAILAIGWPAVVAGMGLATAAAILLGSKLSEIAEIARSKFDTAMERSTTNNTHFNISLKNTSKEWQGLAETTGRVGDGFKNTSKITDNLIDSVDALGKKAAPQAKVFAEALTAAQKAAAKFADQSYALQRKEFFDASRETLGAKTLAKQYEILIKSQDEVAERLAKFRLGLINAWDGLPQFDVADEKLQTLGEFLSDVGGEARRTAAALQAVTLGGDLNKLSRLQNDQRGDALKLDFKQAVKNGEEAFKSSATQAKKYAQQVSLIANDIGRNIADLVFKGGKLKDVMVGTFQEIAKGILRSALETQLKRVVGMLVDIATKAPSVQRALSAIFGLGGSAATGAAGAAGQAAGGVAGAAGSTASTAGKVVGTVASAGLAAIVGAVTGVVSAVSGVIGNVQMHAMNKSLDVIVQHTLRTANQLIYGIQPALNTYLPYLKLIHERSFEAGFGGGSRGGDIYNFSFAGANFGPGVSRQDLEGLFTEAARRKALKGL